MNRKVRISQYFPHFLWERKRSLEALLSKEQQKDSTLRYQIRLGINDIELFVKSQHDPFYLKTNLEAYGKLSPPLSLQPTPFPPTPVGRSPESVKRQPSSPPTSSGVDTKKMRNTSPRHSKFDDIAEVEDNEDTIEVDEE